VRPSIDPVPDRAQVEGLLQAIGRTRVAVVGDFCLDWYLDIDGSASERSIETGLPTWPVRRIRTAPGGAGNVVANLATLGVRGVRCYGVIGADPFAAVLATHLQELGCDVSGLVTQARDWITPTYMKPLVDGIERHRIDTGHANVLSDEVAERVITALAESVEAVDVLIVNQQLARGGVHTPGFRDALARIAPRARIVVVDARQHPEGYGAAVRKLNETEARARAEALDPTPAQGRDLAGVAAALADHWGGVVCVTRGAEGALVAEPGRGVAEVPGIAVEGPTDPVGAGDAFVASFAAALGAGADALSAARLGNLAAAVTVTTIGATGSASPEQLVDLSERVVHRSRPELAASPEAERRLEGGEIDVVPRRPTARVDRRRLRFVPLSARPNRVRIERDRVRPDQPLGRLPAALAAGIDASAADVRGARAEGRPVILAFGAHAIKNGLAPVFAALIEEGWVTHLATNGAGVIHDWEFAFQGASSEDVRENVASGTFGMWHETGLYINLAIAVGAWEGLGYGASVGALVAHDGLLVPAFDELVATARDHAADDPERAAAALDLAGLLRALDLPPGRLHVEHPFAHFGLQATAYRLGVPYTAHPMFGHDIIYLHPANLGAAVGRTAERDFLEFAAAVADLRDGVYLSVGSAVMSPMVFEKSFSMAQNLALQNGAGVTGHKIVVVDLVESPWDWARDGEPPADDPAYYQRYLKTFSRMGGEMRYVAADNRTFLLGLLQALRR
jgi:rfaE bifunctional protein kinase chain/domain